MKDRFMTHRPLVRTFAMTAGVLIAAFIGVPPVAEARGIPAPHEVARALHQRARTHVQHVHQFVDGSAGYHGGDRHGHPRYHGYPRPVYPPLYYGPSYAYGYGYGYGGYGYAPPCAPRGYVSGYVAAPAFGVAVGVTPGQPVYGGY
jgi:hypothetical protein